MNTTTQPSITDLPGDLPAFPNAPQPKDFRESLDMLEETRRLLAEECRRRETLAQHVTDLAHRLDEECRLRERADLERSDAIAAFNNVTAVRSHEARLGIAAVNEADARLTAAAREHAHEVIWSRLQDDRHVPPTWTAAHPPDDSPAIVALATALGDEDFAVYCEAFRAAWAEQVERIADEREVRHGSGRVKI